MIVAVCDYGAGNIASVRRAFDACGATTRLAARPADLAGAAAIVVPGVGHFAATRALHAAWRGAIRARIDHGAPIFGICLGMQWLFDGSDEEPTVPGLGALRGQCRQLGAAGLKVPHVGWNQLQPTRPSRLLAVVRPGAWAYFTHTFAVPQSDATVATTVYGAPFTSVIEDGMVFGTQFHPEKSGVTGLSLVSAFLDAAREGAR